MQAGHRGQLALRHPQDLPQVVLLRVTVQPVAAADAAALEAGEKKGDAPVEDIVDVDPEDLGEAPKNTAAPRKDDVTDADVVVEDGKPRA